MITHFFLRIITHLDIYIFFHLLAVRKLTTLNSIIITNPQSYRDCYYVFVDNYKRITWNSWVERGDWSPPPTPQTRHCSCKLSVVKSTDVLLFLHWIYVWIRKYFVTGNNGLKSAHSGLTSFSFRLFLLCISYNWTTFMEGI